MLGVEAPKNKGGGGAIHIACGWYQNDEW